MFGFDSNGNFGVLILALFSLLIIGGFFMIPPLVISSFNNPVYKDTNCSIIENVSESKIITRTLLMPMGKGALMPMTTHHTEYNHYNVCLNGSIYEVGWY